jgi:hypothetical protein
MSKHREKSEDGTAVAEDKPIVHELKAADEAHKEEDEKLLTEAGWTKQGNLWVNPTRFTCGNEHGRTQSVPDGVARPTTEAAKLERMRPKK